MTEGENKEKQWAMACHLIALIGFLGVPFGHLAGPLAIWLALKKDYPLVADQGKEALNFQLSMTLYGLAASILVMIVVGVFLLGVVVIADIVLIIVASARVFRGESYRYPFTIRFIK